MTVVADAYLLESEADAVATLTSLLRHDLVNLFLYSGEGPPPTVERHINPHSGEETHIGWVTVGTLRQSSHTIGGYRDIRYGCKGKVTHTAISNNLILIAANDSKSTVYQESDLDPSMLRERDMLAFEAAEATRADIYITERPYLYATSLVTSSPLLCCSILDALAIVGLYLRTQGAFLLEGPPHQTSVTKGLFYKIGARELLPESWRWSSACTQFVDTSGSLSLLTLPTTLVRRVEVVLKARDELHRAINQIQDVDAGYDIVDAIDRITLYLMSAVDISARVAHCVLGIKGGSWQSGWQKTNQWLPKVKKSWPPFADIFKESSVQWQVLTILGKLRNTIHGDSLKDIHLRKIGQPNSILLGLPSEQAPEVLRAMDLVGGIASWGVEVEIDQIKLADPARLVDTLLPRVLELLNIIMQTTPVETLAGVVLTDMDCRPPASGKSPANAIYSGEARASIRLQLGL